MKKSRLSKSFPLLITSIALIIILSGCIPVPEGPCQIDTLLISEAALPKDVLEETGSRSVDSAPASVGIEKIGTSFSSVNQGGLVQDVYRFWDAEGAKDEFEDVAQYYFIPREHETEWTTPTDLASLLLQADRYKIACTTIPVRANRYEIGNTATKARDIEICQFVAHYDVYVIYMHVNRIALDHNDLLFLIQDIDHRFSSCFAG